MTRRHLLTVCAAASLIVFSACRPAEESKEVTPQPEAAPLATAPATMATAPSPAALFTNYRVVDLSVLVSENLPAHWGSNPPVQRWTNNWFTPLKNQYGTQNTADEGPYYSQRYIIDEHTGTQVDFPAHFIPPPDSGLPYAGEAGTMTGEKYPLNRLMGPAAVIDVSSILDKAEPGKSPAITVAMIQDWETQNGPIRAGEVVLFRSGYSDKYYKPFPEGRRFTFEPVVMKSAPGWPAPQPQVMDYLYTKGVWHLGTDGASMGPADGGQTVHVAGLKHGMSWEELLTDLDQLPPRGAFYIALPIKVIDQGGAPTRAVAFVPGGPSATVGFSVQPPASGQDASSGQPSPESQAAPQAPGRN